MRAFLFHIHWRLQRVSAQLTAWDKERRWGITLCSYKPHHFNAHLLELLNFLNVIATKNKYFKTWVWIWGGPGKINWTLISLALLKGQFVKIWKWGSWDLQREDHHFKPKIFCLNFQIRWCLSLSHQKWGCHKKFSYILGVTEIG